MKRSSLQSNLDAAVLAGVSGTLVPSKQILTAQAFFDRFTRGEETSYEVAFSIKSGRLIGTASTTVPTSLLRVLKIDQVKIESKSAAISAEALEPMCVMAMHPTRKHTLELKGSVSVIAPDCNIYGNSNHEFDVVDPHTPQNFLTGKFIAAIGGGHHFLQNVTPPVEFGTRLLEDPLSSLSLPAPGACTKTGYQLSGQTMTLPAGHYCSGLIIKSGSKITLQTGGTYFISGGKFAIDASEVTGQDVTIFLTNAGATINWSKAAVRISAQRTGDYAGLAIVGARVETNNSFSESTIDIHGALYMPKGAFEWENTGEPSITAKWSAFIFDGVSWTGDGVIRINFRPKDSDVPYPDGLIAMPRPTKARLVY